MKKLLLNSLAAVALAASASTASAQEHNFEGSYLISNFMMNYLTEEYSFDDLPLVIGEENIVHNFGGYTPFTAITGKVEGNELTFTSPDEYMILDINWDNFHYIVLNGETFGDEFEVAPVTLTYDPATDTYEMSSWMLWDYDPFSGEFEKMAYCMVYGIAPGEAPEEVDYTGTYLVSGTKTVFTDGVASESEEEFIMSIQPDGEGMYEFTNFAGYEVGVVPRGWLGVFGAVYGNDLEIQGTDIALDSNGDGIKLAAPYTEYDSMYTVTIFFNDTESGKISDFSVWEMVAGEPVKQLAKWTSLTFNKSGESHIQSPAEDLEFTDREPVIYYDLRGVKVQNPSNGIYIRRQGNKTSKVIIRN